MTKRYVIYGDTAFAEELSIIITKEARDSVIAFTNDKSFMTRNSINGIPVWSTEELLGAVGSDFELLIAYGYTKMNSLREKIYNECLSYGWNIGTYISPNSICFADCIGEGTIVWPNCYIGPNVKIGRCNIIQASCTLPHDNELGDYNYLAPGVVMGGRSSMKSYCFIGLNSTVKSEVCLEDYTLLGCGCNMLKNSEWGGYLLATPQKCLIKAA